MKILIANASGADVYWGGAERYVRDLRVRLSERGHDVHVLSAFPTQQDDSPNLYVLHDTDWHDNRRRRNLNHVEDWLARPSERIEEVLRRVRPEVVHSNNLPGMSTGLWESARRLGIPVVHTLHDYHLLCPRTSLTKADNTPCHPSPFLCGWRSHRLARWTPAVTLVIGVSAHILARHQSFFGWGTPRVVIRPPVMPIPGNNARRPEQLRSLGFVGALRLSKGVRVLIDAADALGELGVTLRIAGGGPLEGEARAASSIEFVGRLSSEEVARFMSSCDAGLVPSLWEEPGSFVVREWLGAGRPVLATAIGGLIEAAELGGVELFNGSPQGLTALVALIRDSERWAALVDDIPTVDGNSDQDRWVNEHERAYAQALAVTN